MKPRRLVPSLDVADLPDFAFGPSTCGWWGVMGFILTEGAAFVLAVGAYYFLLANEPRWPPASPPPPLGWSTAFLVGLLASEWLNHKVDRAAHAMDAEATRRGLAWVTAAGLALLAVRAFEIAALDVHWTDNAYASIVWALIVLHTFHMVTDVYDTGVLAAVAWRKKLTGRRFSDVSDNALYWHFIVWSWVALYAVVYWTPRWL